MKDKLIVNGIIKFSNVDGPGNRLTIFTQGCNINCIYCHNFETINFCENCGLCVTTCPTNALSIIDGKVFYNKEVCVDCDECIKICENSSSPKTKLYSIDELLGLIKTYEPFLRGITLSGGECTLQANFISKLFKKVKQETKLSCFLDTNGYFDIENEDIQRLIEVTDKFMIDIKCIDNTKKIIGVLENNINIENLEYLLKMDKVYEVRTVVTKDFEYFKPVLKTVSNIIKDYDVTYKIIKMRAKVMKESQKYLETLCPTEKELDAYIDYLKQLGIKRVEKN